MDGHRALSPATFDFAGAATLIYDKHWLGTDEVLKYLAIFHDWDEALLEAWTDSGIEEGLQVLAGIISYVRTRAGRLGSEQMCLWVGCESGGEINRWVADAWMD